MRRLVCIVATACLLVAAAPASADIPAGYTYTDEWITSFDGTKLHAGVFLPADHRPGEQHPTVVVMSPYTAPNGGAASTFAGATESGPHVAYPELFDAKLMRPNRWAVVQIDVRGTGGSGGCWEYYSAN